MSSMTTGALLDRADTEDGDLRLIDDRQAEERAEDPRIRDRERPALHFFGIQLLAARATREIVNRARQRRAGSSRPRS